MQGSIMRTKEVMAEVNVSRATLWRMVKRGAFPAPLKIGARVQAWRTADVQAWMEQLEAVA